MSLLTFEEFKEHGIEDCIFVNKNLFIGSNKTREGSLKMALKTIEIKKNKLIYN